MAEDDRTAAYRAGHASRELPARLKRAAEADPSIFDAWHEGRADRPDELEDLYPSPTARAAGSSSGGGHRRRRSNPGTGHRAGSKAGLSGNPGGSSPAPPAAGGRNPAAPAAAVSSGGLGRPSGRRTPRTSAATRRTLRDAYGGAGRVPRLTAQVLTGRLPSTPAGAVLGILGAAAVVNWIGGGWPQLKGWLAAKFLNKPYGSSSSSAANPSAKAAANASSSSTSDASGTAQIIQLPASPQGPPPPGMVSV